MGALIVRGRWGNALKKRKPGYWIFAAVAAVFFQGAFAQDYPNKSIRFIVPFPPGGSGDLVARAIGAKLGEGWNVPVVADNRAGAGGNIGALAVARAPADGYTILLGTQSSQIIGPIMQEPPPFDPIRDFTPVSLAVVIPLILTSNPSLPARSVRELVQLARSQPGKINFGSTGVATSTHLAGELFKRMAKIDIVHVPYKGGGPATADLLGGNIQLLFGSLSTTLPAVKSGKLRALGVAGSKRSAAAPDLPTIGEQLPGFEFMQWLGILAPPRLPPAILRTLNAEVVKVLQIPAIVENFAGQGLEPAGNTPDEFLAFLKTEMSTWGRVIKEANIKTE